MQFAPESLSEKKFEEPSSLEGPQSITFVIERVEGTLGNITVFLFLSRGLFINTVF